MTTKRYRGKSKKKNSRQLNRVDDTNWVKGVKQRRGGGGDADDDDERGGDDTGGE